MFKTKRGKKNENILNSLIKIHLYKTQNKKLNIKTMTTGCQIKGNNLKLKQLRDKKGTR